MKIAYVHGGKSVPSYMFRRSFFEQLSDKGHQVSYYSSLPGRYDSWPPIGWRASQFLKRQVRSAQMEMIRSRNYDTVVLETGLFHNDDVSMEVKLRRVSKRFVYDIDDAVFLLFPEKINRIVEMADHVIAGNEAIADRVTATNSSVSVIPTCVGVTQYPSKWDRHCPGEPTTRHKKTVIGWVGSSGNLPFLKSYLPVFENLANEFPLEVRIVTAARSHETFSSTRPDLIRWIDIDRCNVSEQVRLFDIGIMPLPLDDEWCQYKCNVKLVQYMMSGLAVISSDVGYNRTIVQNGVTGLLASTSEDWIRACRTLATDVAMRRKLGLEARKAIVRTHTVESRLDDFEVAILGI